MIGRRRSGRIRRRHGRFSKRWGDLSPGPRGKWLGLANRVEAALKGKYPWRSALPADGSSSSATSAGSPTSVPVSPAGFFERVSTKVATISTRLLPS
jgi:hypothetical protein